MGGIQNHDKKGTLVNQSIMKEKIIELFDVARQLAEKVDMIGYCSGWNNLNDAISVYLARGDRNTWAVNFNEVEIKGYMGSIQMPINTDKEYLSQMVSEGRELLANLKAREEGEITKRKLQRKEELTTLLEGVQRELSELTNEEKS